MGGAGEVGVTATDGDEADDVATVGVGAIDVVGSASVGADPVALPPELEHAFSAASIGPTPAPSADQRIRSRLLMFIPIAQCDTRPDTWCTSSSGGLLIDRLSCPLPDRSGRRRTIGAMARIALPETSTLDIINALSTVRPELAKAVGGMDAAVAASTLDPRVHELVRMRVAQINACTVCLAWRTPAAVAAGITEALLDQVESFATSTDLSDTEKVAIEYAERFSRDSANIDDAFIARLSEHFTPGDIVELTLVIGKYVAFGRFMQVLGLDQSCGLDYAQQVGAQPG